MTALTQLPRPAHGRRLPYTPPEIRRHRGGGSEALARNRFAFGARSPLCEAIEGVGVADLAARFGSPLFVFSERVLRDTVRRANEAFKSRYPDTQFAWSYKTNYLSAICAVFHSEGSIAEVVSEFEYEKARKLGIEGCDIVFNGPHKSRAGLETAIAEGAMLQVDNWDELLLIEAIAAERQVQVPVALRVWLDAGILPVWSKFGFGLEAGEAWRAIKRIHQSNGRLRLRGLHTHIGTYILEPRAYGVAAEKLCALSERARQEYGTRIEYLNLGGGFPSRSTLHYAYAPAEQTVPPIERYAEAIATVLNALPPARRPRLILESGRALVDEAGYLVTSVVAVKGGTQGGVGAAAMDLSGTAAKQALVMPEAAASSLIIDAGVNLLYTASWFRFDVKPARAAVGAQPAPVKLYGNLCMNIDVVREQVALPPQNVGDHLVLHPVGAYNITQSMQFIAYRPAVVMIGLDGAVELIRARETLEDVERPERMPARLARQGAGFPRAQDGAHA